MSNSSDSCIGRNDTMTQSLHPKNQWIIDLLQTQLQRQAGPQRNAYTRAIRSLEHCPCHIVNEHRATEIKGIGPAFAKSIVRKLKQRYEYIHETPLEAKSIVRKQYKEHQMRQKETLVPSPQKKRKSYRKKPKKAYKPRIGTGGYALLIYMYKAYKNDGTKQFTKAQLQRDAQPYSDTSFTDTKGGHYSAWSAMSTLIKYDYVKSIDCGRNQSVYCLLEPGKQIAMILYSDLFNVPLPSQPDLAIFNTFALNHKEEDESRDKHNFICPYCDRTYVREKPFMNHVATKHPNGQNAKVRPTLLPQYQPKQDDASSMDHNRRKRRNEDAMTFVDGLMRPAKRQKIDADSKKAIRINGEWFELYLVYDTGEERRKGSNERVTLHNQFSGYPIHSKPATLSIGDFCWTLKSVRDGKKEYLYPIIVERKRMDDLAQSIVDKRYCEQKWRMRRSVPYFHHIYLVEAHTIDDESTKKRIHQSVVNTEIADGFLVYRTKSSLESNRVLAGWTRIIHQRIVNELQTNEDCHFLEFERFNSSMDNKKHFGISAQMLFGRQLMAVNGVTDVMAYVITRKYKTMRQLYDAWDNCEDAQKAKLLLYHEIDGTYSDYHRDLDSGVVKMDQDLCNAYHAMDQAKLKLISERVSDKIWKSFYNA